MSGHNSEEAACPALLITANHSLAADPAVKTVQLTIEGMCCAGCLPDIEQ